MKLKLEVAVRDDLKRKSGYYCLYKLQIEKRIMRGESESQFPTCSVCNGYNNQCNNYTPRIHVR